jgi:hypothetical protein
MTVSRVTFKASTGRIRIVLRAKKRRQDRRAPKLAKLLGWDWRRGWPVGGEILI